MILRRTALLLTAALLFSGAPARAEEEQTAAGSLADARQFHQSGQYFKSARYAFGAMGLDPMVKPEAYSWITLNLIQAGLHQSASYFFIKTLQTGEKTAIRRVLTKTQDLLSHTGGDLIRKYLIRHTTYEDYDSTNRSAYLYALAKSAILSGDETRAIGYLNGIDEGSPVFPFVLQLRASAEAILGKNAESIEDFERCAARSGDVPQLKGRGHEANDLKARCQAGVARVLYQQDKFEEADRAYDRIDKRMLVWPDILFEQAWNSFGKREYNRTLGRLVTYKSPALAFVWNSEIDVLRAQSYLALCLYSDANDVINEFNGKYGSLERTVKQFVESNASRLGSFYGAGKEALHDSLYTHDEFHRMMNRFVRGPYFQDLVASEREVAAELQAVKQFDWAQAGVSHRAGEGFPGFLEQVLQWRLNAVALLGGSYVKNSLIDYHQSLVSDFDKMSFIKLEMLKRAKEQLLSKGSPALQRADSERENARGNVKPVRRDDQYYWSFNGEFWNDELGDYVFGLESKCGT
ncbi:MAG: tetratricopeptide repeat protein [Bdellovibrionota bacterium]